MPHIQPENEVLSFEIINKASLLMDGILPLDELIQKYVEKFIRLEELDANGAQVYSLARIKEITMVTYGTSRQKKYNFTCEVPHLVNGVWHTFLRVVDYSNISGPNPTTDEVENLKRYLVHEQTQQASPQASRQVLPEQQLMRNELAKYILSQEGKVDYSKIMNQYEGQYTRFSYSRYEDTLRSQITRYGYGRIIKPVVCNFKSELHYSVNTESYIEVEALQTELPSNAKVNDPKFQIELIDEYLEQNNYLGLVKNPDTLELTQPILTRNNILPNIERSIKELANILNGKLTIVMLKDATGQDYYTIGVITGVVQGIPYSGFSDKEEKQADIYLAINSSYFDRCEIKKRIDEVRLYSILHSKADTKLIRDYLRTSIDNNTLQHILNAAQTPLPAAVGGKVLIRLDEVLNAEPTFIDQLDYYLQQQNYFGLVRNKSTLQLNKEVLNRNAISAYLHRPLNEIKAQLVGEIILARLSIDDKPEEQILVTIVDIEEGEEYTGFDLVGRKTNLYFNVQCAKFENKQKSIYKGSIPITAIFIQAPSTENYRDYLYSLVDERKLTPIFPVTHNTLALKDDLSLEEKNHRFEGAVIFYRTANQPTSKYQFGKIYKFTQGNGYKLSIPTEVNFTFEIEYPHVTDDGIRLTKTQVYLNALSNFPPTPQERMVLNFVQPLALKGMIFPELLTEKKYSKPLSIESYPDDMADFSKENLFTDLSLNNSSESLSKKYSGKIVCLKDLTLLDKAFCVGKIVGVTTGPQYTIKQAPHGEQNTNLYFSVIAISEKDDKLFLAKRNISFNMVTPFSGDNENQLMKKKLKYRLKKIARCINLEMVIPVEKCIEIDDVISNVIEEHPAINHIKQTLQNILKDYIEFDEQGNPSKARLEQPQFDEKLEEEIGDILYELASKGDAAYATRVRILLASAKYISKQVNGNGHLVSNQVRPSTFQRESQQQSTQDAQASRAKPKKNRVWDYFYFKIYSGTKNAQKGKENTARSQAESDSDSDNENNVCSYQSKSSYTQPQMQDYEHRKQRTAMLHAKGELFIRVVNAKEITQCFGFQYLWNNTSLSTSLLPAKGSTVNMRLFSEGDEAICLFLDPHRASEKDFGATYFKNAFTWSDGFAKQRSRAVEPIASSKWTDMVRLHQDYNERLKQGKSINERDMFVEPDSTNEKRWVAKDKRPDPHNPGIYPIEKNQISHNETTFYRAVERDMIIAFGIKSNTVNYGQNLKKLALIQALVRQNKNLYLPIYHLDSKRNQLDEIQFGRNELAFLKLSHKLIPHPNYTTSLFHKIMQSANISIDEINSAMTIAKEQPSINEILNMLLMALNLNDATDTISIYDQKDKEIKEIRLIDNMHLLFPGNFGTGNTKAIKQGLKLIDSDISLIEENQPLKQLFKVTIFENMKKMLGIDLTKPKGQQFNPSVSDLYDSNEASKDARNVKKPDFSRVLLRVHRSLLCLNLVSQQEILAIFQEIKNAFPSIVLPEIVLPENVPVQRSSSNTRGDYTTTMFSSAVGEYNPPPRGGVGARL